MNIDRVVLAFAGMLVLIGVALGVWITPYWLLLPAFVGFNLLQASFSGFCPLAILLKKMGVAPGNAF